jgi:glutathione peroxidase-family protein
VLFAQNPSLPQVKDIDGKSIKLDKYKGQVLLVVNLASACGCVTACCFLPDLALT